MLDYKDIIIKHYGGGMSGSELAAKGLGSKSGINDFLRAFEACEKIGYPLLQITSRKATMHGVTRPLCEGGEVKILFEIMEKRSELHNSTIVCSQREPKSWTAMILNDAVAADAQRKRATQHHTVFIAPR